MSNDHRVQMTPIKAVAGDLWVISLDTVKSCKVCEKSS